MRETGARNGRFRTPVLVCEDCGEAASGPRGAVEDSAVCERCGGTLRGKSQLALIRAGTTGSLDVVEVRCDGCGATRFDSAADAEEQDGMECARADCEGRRRAVGLAF